MNNIVSLRGGQMPAAFASRSNLPDMASATHQGLAAGFAVIGYKGRNWRIKYAGRDELLMDGRNVPIPALDVVVVGVSPAISKQWYGKRFVEGDNEAPDCFSTNGIAPDPISPKPQSPTCAACPHNEWGSRLTDAGKKAKECQDARRIAVVPTGDIINKDYGGPMLLRVPPMSLNNLAKFGTEVTRHGAQPYMVSTQLHFNYDVAYPLIEFTATGWLTEEQAEAIAVVMEDPLIKRILDPDGGGHESAPVTPTSPLAGGGPAAAFAQKPDAQAAQAQAQANAEAQALAQKQAEAQAWEAKRQADLAQQQANAAVEAAKAQAQAAPPKASPFVTATQPPDDVQAPAPVSNTTTTVAATAPAPTSAPAAVIQGAPADMESAIDSLLAG